MVNLLAGLTFILWGLQLLGVLSVSATVLGLLALITGILWIASGFVTIPTFPVHRRAE